MTRSELIKKIVEHFPHLTQAQVEEIVCKIFEEIKNALVDGNRVEMRSFGSFSIRFKKARQAHNPRTKEVVSIPAKRIPIFKVGKGLRRLINS